jgi:hypothetical protein
MDFNAEARSVAPCLATHTGARGGAEPGAAIALPDHSRL